MCSKLFIKVLNLYIIEYETSFKNYARGIDRGS